ncbi:MAG TPA: branched-chain amino acid ABC transporter permease [Ktedonobacterales bacterium]|nr:branched-chain amino acid ABC transporter permease [Ktedonobacterales bacterium]
MSASTPDTPSTPDAAPAPGAPPAARPRPLASSRSRALLVFGVIVLAVIFLFGGDGWVSLLDLTMIMAIAALGLNVLSGYAGQISLGISFFMGVGAYTAAWLGGSPPQFPGDPSGLGLSFIIWLPAAGVVAAILGALIGPTALRLKGFYLAIVTLALVFIGQYFFINLKSITGGQQGRFDFPAPTIGSFSFASPDEIFGFTPTINQCFFVLALVVLALAAIFVGNLARTRVGRAWQAVRDNEIAASIMGVNLLEAKMGAFVLSSFLAGIAGALYSSFVGIATPGTWGLLLSIQFVAAILIGGVASVWGSILGAAFIFAVPTALDTFSLLPQSASATGISSGDLSAIIYGLLIIVFMLFEPAGVVGLIRRLLAASQRLDGRRKGGETATPTPVAQESQLDVERINLARPSDAPQPPV